MASAAGDDVLPPDFSEQAPQPFAFDAIPYLSPDHMDSPTFFFDINAVTASMTVSISKFRASAISSG